MKKIVIVILFLNCFLNGFNQEVTKEVPCFEYPNNDQILDASIMNIAENSLEYKKLFINFFNKLDKSEKEALGYALTNNDTTFLQQYPALANPQIMELVVFIINQYRIAWARQKELFPHTDSAINFENLNKSIICCIEKISLHSDNTFARAEVDCYRLWVKCYKKVDTNYGWCMFWSGLGGLGSAVVGTPAAGIATFAVGMTKCAFGAAIGTKDCDDAYTECIKNQNH